MATYKNDYSKDEDETLWELHEIRDKLHKEFENKTLEEINRDALEKFESWKKERSKGIKVSL
jgi:hypothetical protein